MLQIRPLSSSLASFYTIKSIDGAINPLDFARSLNRPNAGALLCYEDNISYGYLLYCISRAKATIYIEKMHISPDGDNFQKTAGGLGVSDVLLMRIMTTASLKDYKVVASVPESSLSQQNTYKRSGFLAKSFDRAKHEILMVYGATSPPSLT